MKFSRGQESASGSPSENGFVLTRGNSQPMNTTDAIRWLNYEAGRCRDRDSAEALCLLLPALLQAFELRPMGDIEAAAFRERVKGAVQRDLRRAA